MELKNRKDMNPEFMWDFTHIFPTKEAWEAAYKEAEAMTAGLAAYEGTLGESAAALQKALDAVNAAGEKLERVYLYAMLHKSGDNGDPDNFMNLLADATPTMNIAQFDNADYKALIAKGVATSDDNERADIYKQCEQIVADQNPWLLISHAKNLAGYNPKVSGFVIHPTGVVRLWNAVKTN